MTELRPEYVVGARVRGWATLLFFIAILYGAWFFFVILGEHLNFTADPGKWTGLDKQTWAFIGTALYVLIGAVLIAFLIRHEIPARVYNVGMPEPEANPGDAAPMGSPEKEMDAVVVEPKQPPQG